MNDLLEKLASFGAREKAPSQEATHAINVRKLVVANAAPVALTELGREHPEIIAVEAPRPDSRVADYGQHNFQYATAAELAKLAEMRARQALEVIDDQPV